MESKFIKGFIQVLKEQIAQDNLVSIDGIGQFRKVHHTQIRKKQEDGSVVLIPPKDTIEFKPDISKSS